MAAINIQSLFADIIDTPEQRQMKMLQEGMLRGDRLASGLTGLTRAAAPLAQVAGQLGVQRQENLRRAVQPMLGIDPRTTGEKLQEQIGRFDTSTPTGLMQAAQAIQQIDPIRAAALRQAATEQTQANEDRTRRVQLETLQLESAQRAAKDEEAQALIRENQATLYKAAGMPLADIEAYKAGALSPAQMAELKIKYTESLTSNNPRIANMTPFTQEEQRQARLYLDQNSDASKQWEEIQKLKKNPESWWQNLTGSRDPMFTEEDLFREAAVIQALNDNKIMYDEAIQRALVTLPRGGIRSIQGMTQRQNDLIGQRLGLGTATPPSVNTTALAGSETQAGFDVSGFDQQAIDALVADVEQRMSGERAPVSPTPTTPPAPTPSAVAASTTDMRRGRAGGAGGTRARTIDEVISSLETGQQTIDTPARRSGRSVVGQDRNMVNLMRSVTQSIAPPESYNPNRRVRGSRGAAGREETPAAVSANQMSYNQIVNQTPPAPTTVPTLAREPLSASYEEMVQASNAVTPVNVEGITDAKTKRDAVKFNDYLDAAQKLNFPVLPELAKGLQQIPAITAGMVTTMTAIAETLSSREKTGEVINAGFKRTLDEAAELVGALVRGQANPEELGEDALQAIEAAERKLKELRSGVGQLSADARRPVQQASNALLEFVSSYKKRYNLPVRPQFQ
jgi:hypothetical protein